MPDILTDGLPVAVTLAGDARAAGAHYLPPSQRVQQLRGRALSTPGQPVSSLDTGALSWVNSVSFCIESRFP